MITLDTIAHIYWNFNKVFLLEVQTDNADITYNYVWSDPDYGGDNTIRPYRGTPENFTHIGFCGRDKGNHSVKNYCGEKVIFIHTK